MCLSAADNEETVRLMKASGCKVIFAGLESVSEETLRAQNKETINRVHRYRKQSETLLKHGIFTVGAIMFGFDQDTEDLLFHRTLKVVKEMGLSLLQTHLVTPYPHLDHYKVLDSQDRIITKDTKYYNGYTVVHRPQNIHPADLQEGFIRIRKRFYSLPSILRRMFKHKISKLPEFLFLNALYRTPNYQVIPGVDIKEWLKYLRTL
jgi:radical SAM superfamily enzyme YgiQ (UPF0313 family)